MILKSQRDSSDGSTHSFYFGKALSRRRHEKLYLAVVHFIFSHLININTYLRRHLDYNRLKTSRRKERRFCKRKSFSFTKQSIGRLWKRFKSHDLALMLQVRSKFYEILFKIILPISILFVHELRQGTSSINRQRAKFWGRRGGLEEKLQRISRLGWVGREMKRDGPPKSNNNKKGPKNFCGSDRQVFIPALILLTKN